MIDSLCSVALLAALAQDAGPVPAPETTNVRTALATYVDACSDHGLRGSFEVARGGDVLYSAAVGARDVRTGKELTSEHLLDYGTLAGAFTACAIVALENEEKLATTDALRRFFPDAPEDMAGITLLDLMAHRSGLRTGLVGRRAPDRDTFVKRVFARQLEREIGSEYHFSLEGYGLLAAVIEVTSEMSFEDYVRTRVFEPAGMETVRFARAGASDAAVGHEQERPVPATDAGWGTKGSGGVWGRAQDLTAFVDWLLRGDGPGAGARALLTAAFDPEGHALSFVTRGKRGARIYELRGDVLGFEGFVHYDEAADLSVVALLNERSVWGGVFERLVELARGGELPSPARVVRMSLEELQEFAGEYKVPGRGRVDLWVENDRLLVGPVGQAATNLLFYRLPTGNPVDQFVATKTAKILEALREDDRLALDRALAEPDLVAAVDAFWEEEWLANLGEYGAIVDLGVESSSTRAGRSTVVARVIYEDGSAGLRFVWQDEQVVDVTFADPYGVAAQLAPIAPDEFQLFDPDPARTATLRFYRTAEGAIDRFRFATRTHAMRCARVRSDE